VRAEAEVDDVKEVRARAQGREQGHGLARAGRAAEEQRAVLGQPCVDDSLWGEEGKEEGRGEGRRQWVISFGAGGARPSSSVDAGVGGREGGRSCRG